MVAMTKSPEVGIYLFLLAKYEKKAEIRHTRPPLNSIQAAFFLLSVHSWPATVGVMVLGGKCRSPGPSFKGNVGCEGKVSESRLSPGRTNLSMVTAMLDN